VGELGAYNNFETLHKDLPRTYGVDSINATPERPYEKATTVESEGRLVRSVQQIAPNSPTAHDKFVGDFFLFFSCYHSCFSSI
jgi:hypothetical protein